MRAFAEFRHMDPSFWALVKFVSEKLGYSKRGKERVEKYSAKSVQALCKKHGINVSEDTIINIVKYSKLRTDLLNDFASKMLMDAQTAKEEFLRLEELYKKENYLCKLPLNKQKGEKRQIAFFTAIINILAEKTIREITGNTQVLGFDDAPSALAYVWDECGRIVGASSRRFDGAYPSIKSPKMVWEIKEYYYATTFGSRVADGVYETQLDGFEINEIYERTGKKVYHVLFVDAYQTWWVKGKSYLCRLVDAINAGIVDEVIVGREVFTRWPEILHSIVEK